MLHNLAKKTHHFLRYTQKYTGTDNEYLLREGGWLTLGQVVSSASAFFLAIAFANLLPKETYGTYRYVLAVVGILAIPTLPSMAAAVIQAVARGYEGSFIEALKTKLKWGFLATPASLALSAYYIFNGNYVLSISFLIAALFLPIMEAFGLYQSFLQGKKYFGESTKYYIATQVLSALILITTVILTKNILLILLAYFIPATILRFLFLQITQAKFKPSKKHDPKSISFGKHLSIINILEIAATNVDKVLLFHYLGAVQVAVYIFAITVPNQIKSFLKLIPKLAYPKFSEKSKEEIRLTIFKKIFILSLSMIPVVILYFLIAPHLYKIAFPQFVESINYSRIFALTLLVPSGLAGSAIKSQRATKKTYMLSVFSNVTQILLMFTLVILGYGIWGIIIGKVAAQFLRFGLSIILVKRL